MDKKSRTPVEALNAAIAHFGTLSAMAAALPGVKSYQVIQQWRENGVPVEHCSAIEMATNGGVTRQELRPDDWQRIWPELLTDRSKTKKPVVLADQRAA